MKRLFFLLLAAAQLLAANLFSQISFTNKSSLLSPEAHFSGVAIAIVDMNGDGLDDIVRLNQGTNLNIQYQTAPNAAFGALQVGLLPGVTASQWGMCVGDIDNNGYADVLAGGRYDGVKIARASADGTSFNITNLTLPGTFVQGVNFADINNDGWLDAFVCHDDGVSRIYGNNGDGTFTYQPMWMNLATVPASDNSGNYGSLWSDVDNDNDLDLYIAHCRQGVNNASDPRRINQLFLNNGNGTFTQDITNASGLRIGYQSWTADFGDIDNDGDFDCLVTNHDWNNQLLLNDGSGHFTDISISTGIAAENFGSSIQGVFRDFDNDGFVDILVAGSKQVLMRNNGNKTFTKLANPFNNAIMESFAIGDLNNDGFQDIYGGYANIYTTPTTTPDVLWMNNGNSNHFFGLNLRGIQSNRGSVGAKVQLYSSLGIQTREVRAGESYGISNAQQIHFGLGQVEVIDSVVVRWPSGIRHVIYQPDRDQYLTFTEAGCQVKAIHLEVLGSPMICSGQSVDIQAPVGYAYHWNTGDTTQTITVSTADEYRVTVTSANGCSAVSNGVEVVVDPIVAPVIAVSGDTIVCAGTNLVLTATEAPAYLWSNGASSQSINVSQSGVYQVTTQSLCAQLTSKPVHITVLPAPTPQMLPGFIVLDSTSALTVKGSSLTWYDSENSTTPLPGNPLIQHPDNPSVEYWLAQTTTYDQPNQFVGMTSHQGSVLSDNSYNGGLIFDCLTPFTLAKTKVTTSVAGSRKIDLFDSNQQLLQTKTVDIPVGTSIIDLGFDIPAGDDLLLTTDVTVNQANIGTASPQLLRSTTGCHYPYSIPGYVDIKNSTLDETRYYYFFDWEVDFPEYTCESRRTKVHAPVSAVKEADAPDWASGVIVYPNPGADILHLSIDAYTGGRLNLSLKNIQGVTVQQHRFNPGAAKFQTSLDICQIPRGIYWLELAGDTGVVRKMVVVQ